jgi:hypothetical protein
VPSSPNPHSPGIQSSSLESQSEASSQPARFRSDYRRFMHPSHAPGSHAAMSHCPKTTLLPFHHGLTKRKYRMLFSSQRGRRPGPKGPAKELIDVVVGMKRRNPTWIVRVFPANYVGLRPGHHKDMVRRIVRKHYRLESGFGGRLGSPFSVRRTIVCGVVLQRFASASACASVRRLDPAYARAI